MARLFDQRAWQLATIAVGVMAVALALLWASQWASDARRIAGLSTQLSAFSQGLGQLSSQVNAAAQTLQVAYKPNASPNLSDTDFTQVYANLKGIEEGLNTLKLTLQVSPERAPPGPQPQQIQ
jgi:outer membrane murein-binding lipoprotein Lpp